LLRLFLDTDDGDGMFFEKQVHSYQTIRPQVPDERTLMQRAAYFLSGAIICLWKRTLFHGVNYVTCPVTLCVSKLPSASPWHYRSRGAVSSVALLCIRTELENSCKDLYFAVVTN
jgi:hypothetical protein